ncbi:MAG: hypothetical protein LBD28_04210 [Tannerellaceae bacterium]|jgi:hypothetical protein|nr:hypothetical protein [Tannerellaceae bacterium]
MKKNYLLAIAMLAILYSCGEALMDYGLNTQTPIVESYLQEGANSLTVNVYSMEEYLKDEYVLSKPISGLSLTINGEAIAETSAGRYQLDLGADTLREGQAFRLQFDYNGKSIEASATVPAPVRNLRVDPEYLALSASSYLWDSSDTTEVIISWDDPDGSYYQVYIESPNTTDMPSFGIFGRRMMQPFRGGSYRATARDFRSAGVHWIYVYRVGKDYVELYERISASDLANPVSFIQNAFGIFTSMSYARVRLWAVESSE